MIMLSILIPTINRHLGYLSVLLRSLNEQIENGGFGDMVEIIVLDGETETTGAKRNTLLESAKGEYVTFVDADDEVSPDYIGEILKAVESNPDVVSFDGFMTTNNSNRENFKIGKDLPYMTSFDENGKNLYLRHNNHLSPVKRGIALQIKFPDKTQFEDYDYCVRLKESKLIKTEVYIAKDLYHYKFLTGKR